MKKLAILVGAIALTTTTFAQKATMDNPFSLEGVMNINSGVQWMAPSIRARYFVSENIAIRAELGLGDGLGTPSSAHYDFSEHTGPGNADSTDNPVGTTDMKNSAWNAQIGAEYHLAGTDRISPYFMLGINFGGGSTETVNDQSNGSSYSEGYTSTETAKTSMFGVGLGAGIDVYIIENLYIGLELGLSFNSQSTKDQTFVSESSSTVAGVTTVTKVNSFSDDSKANYLSTGAGNAAIRLGWRF